MSTQQQVKKRRRIAPTQKTTQSDVRQPEISFRKLWVTRAAFQELAKLAAAEAEAPQGYPVELGIAVKVLVSPENVGRVLMTLSVNGDQRSRPYRLHLEIVGEFAGKSGASRDEVLGFCRDAGPTLLFPYARQIIERMTSDGFYGPIRLDPIYLRQMLTEQTWQNEPDAAKNVPGEASSANETEQRD